MPWRPARDALSHDEVLRKPGACEPCDVLQSTEFLKETCVDASVLTQSMAPVSRAAKSGLTNRSACVRINPFLF